MQQTIPYSRTKRQLADALRAALARKPLLRIPIRELTEVCQIKRQSFYYHFDDIFQLLDWMLQEDQEQFHAACQRGPGEEPDLDHAVHALVSYAGANHSLLRNIIRTPDARAAASLRAMLRACCEDIIQLGMQVGAFHMVDAQYLEFLGNYLASALYGTLAQWLDGSLDVDTEALEVLLSRLIHEQFVGSFLMNTMAQQETRARS